MVFGKAHLLFFGAISITLSACGGSSSSPSENTIDRGTDDNTAYTSAAVDASSNDHYTYFNLITNEVVALSDIEANTSTDWHLGFRRNAIIMNGGSSGPGKVAGAIAYNQDEFYNNGEADPNILLNVAADSELDHLLATYDLSALTFEQDAKSSAISVSQSVLGTQMDMGWYFYDFTTHAITLNEDNFWFLRSNTGKSYAQFHATQLTYDQTNGLAVTFEFSVQPQDATQFTHSATFETQIASTGGESCFDFDNDTSTSCQETDWDLKLEIADRAITLWTNSGVTASGAGGAFGPQNTQTATAYNSATISPTGDNIEFHYAQDSSAGLFSANLWYAYNLEGNHQLWPNYRVYVIDTDSSNPDSIKFKFQLTNYYSNTGTSGNPHFRFIEIPNS